MRVLGAVTAAAVAAAMAMPGTAAMPSAEAQARLLAAADARTFDAALLRSLSTDPDPMVRTQCATTIGLLANADGARILPALAADPVAAVRAAAVTATGRLAEALPARAPERTALAPLLEQALRDRDVEVRTAGAWAVGRARPPEGELWLLHRAARERDAPVRAAMLQELWRFSGKLWPKRAMSFLADRSAEVRLATAWSLARCARLEAAAGLGRAATDVDARVRTVAFNGAARLGAGSLWAAAVAGVTDPDRDARVAALLAVEALANSGAGQPLAPRAAEQIARAVLSTDPARDAAQLKVMASWGVEARAVLPDFARAQERVAAIRAAGATGCGEKELRVALAADTPWISAEALGALLRQRAAGAAVKVVEWLGSSEPARRRAAVKLVPLLPDAVGRLKAALDDSDAEVRLAAVEAASRVPGGAITDALTRRLADADAAVSAAAVEELGRRKALPSVGAIVGLLDNVHGAAAPDVAETLIAALVSPARLGPEAKAALQRHLADHDPAVARAAWSALVASGEAAPLPPVETGQDLGFYRKVLDWAGKERFLEIVTVRGTMQVRLDTAVAPLTCYRIVELAGKHFFDDLTFHRVVPDFVVQGGDPRGDGRGGPGYVVRDELGPAPYLPGTVGMALAGPDTGGSQFFVTLTRQPHLDGRYPRIGNVVNGLDVATRIRSGDRILRVRAGEGAVPAYFPVWYGPLAPERLDAGVDGWRQEREKYHPREKWIELLRTAKVSYTLTVAMGTWCSDSREQVPRLQAVLTALGPHPPFGVPRLIGVDRSKEIDRSLYPFGVVEAVPTIVVSAGGAEIGRLVESPKTTSVEEDLVRILAPVEGWDLPAPEATTPPGA